MGGLKIKISQYLVFYKIHKNKTNLIYFLSTVTYLFCFFFYHLKTIFNLDYNQNDALMAAPALAYSQNLKPYGQVSTFYGPLLPLLQSRFLTITSFGSIYNLRLLQIFVILINLSLLFASAYFLAKMYNLKVLPFYLAVGLYGFLHYTNVFTPLQSWLSDYVTTMQILLFLIFLLLTKINQSTVKEILIFCLAIVLLALFYSRLREGSVIILGIFIFAVISYQNNRTISKIFVKVLIYFIALSLFLFFLIFLLGYLSDFFQQVIYFPNEWRAIAGKNGLNSNLTLLIMLINLSPVIISIGLLFLKFRNKYLNFFQSGILFLASLIYLVAGITLTNFYSPSSRQPFDTVYLYASPSIITQFIRFSLNFLIGISYFVSFSFFVLTLYILIKAAYDLYLKRSSFNGSKDCYVTGILLVLSLSSLSQIYPTWDIRHNWWGLSLPMLTSVFLLQYYLKVSAKRLNFVLISFFMLSFLFSTTTKVSYINQERLNMLSPLTSGMISLPSISKEFNEQYIFLSENLPVGLPITNNCKNALPVVFNNQYNSEDKYFIDIVVKNNQVDSYDFTNRYPSLKPINERQFESGPYVFCSENGYSVFMSLPPEKLGKIIKTESDKFKIAYLE